MRCGASGAILDCVHARFRADRSEPAAAAAAHQAEPDAGRDARLLSHRAPFVRGYEQVPCSLVTENESNIREVGRRLAAEVPDARVVLFGSHARGSATPRSDIDVLVIEPEVENTALESVRLMRAVRDLRLPVEIVVVSEREAAEWRDVRGSLVHAALSEGRVLAA